MELICPACEARYQIPDGSIGEKGRQVSCMNCGHGWHAFPPLILGEPSLPGNLGAAGAAAMAATPQMGQPPGGPRMHGDEGPSGMTEAVSERTDTTIRSDTSRTEQLAEIRDMLAEVQSEDRMQEQLSQSAPDANSSGWDSAGSATEEQAVSGLAAATAASVDDHVVERDPDEDSEIDPLRRRMEMHESKGEAAKPPDVKKLRRKHDRKVRHQKHQKAAGSGAFMTGFLLVVMIAAVMIALYMLHPQIIEQMPGAENALTQYVETIDGLRISVAETFTGIVDWVVEKST